MQRAVAKCYSRMQRRFEGNSLVSGMWASMGDELQGQAENLKKLPLSFWQSLKHQEKELLAAANLNLPNDLTGSLRTCLAQMLDLEEPIIFGVYVPLIRRLRSNWTDLALDFYVAVKAHISKLARSIQLFSGDPALGMRCELLLQNFETAVHRSAANEAETARPAAKARSSRRKIAGAKPLARKRARTSAAAKAKPARALNKISKRTKPMVGKIKIQRRQAQR